MNHETSPRKLIGWILLLFGLSLLAFWVEEVLSSQYRRNNLRWNDEDNLLLLIALLNVMAGIGFLLRKLYGLYLLRGSFTLLFGGLFIAYLIFGVPELLSRGEAIIFIAFAGLIFAAGLGVYLLFHQSTYLWFKKPDSNNEDQNILDHLEDDTK